ncbi:hypothetical protein ZHAS_00017027 [Anopheles sinensis]|uniref:Uncharacterized protein n=1 Tax=Anopheles sinensis TaxID=74873 RepID=A0A084WFM4_ANOSI|nr:hypothetical protein ZHAS_00017027 [Anopheles sinensis]
MVPGTSWKFATCNALRTIVPGPVAPCRLEINLLQIGTFRLGAHGGEPFVVWWIEPPLPARRSGPLITHDW